MPDSLPAGPTTFTVTNAGTIEHSFEIEGQGIEQQLEHHLKPGESMDLQVDLAPGNVRGVLPGGWPQGAGYGARCDRQVAIAVRGG